MIGLSCQYKLYRLYDSVKSDFRSNNYDCKTRSKHKHYFVQLVLM